LYNNPFKKRKCDEIQLVQVQSIAEQVSVATDENFDILCLTPDNTPLEVLDESARKRRRSDIYSDQIADQISGITEVEDSDIMCINFESQGSVNSKPKKVIDGKRRGKTEKSKRSDPLSPFLFVLVMEAFSRMIDAIYSRGADFRFFCGCEGSWASGGFSSFICR
jgi:hypothetical protein